MTRPAASRRPNRAPASRTTKERARSAKKAATRSGRTIPPATPPRRAKVPARPRSRSRARRSPASRRSSNSNNSRRRASPRRLAARVLRSLPAAATTPTRSRPRRGQPARATRWPEAAAATRPANHRRSSSPAPRRRAMPPTSITPVSRLIWALDYLAPSACQGQARPAAVGAFGLDAGGPGEVLPAVGPDASRGRV